MSVPDLSATVPSGSPLLDFQLEELVSSHKLIKNFNPSFLSGCGYDLRVGSILKSRNRQTSFDLLKAEYVVESGECITIDSLEEVNFRTTPVFGYIVNKHTLVAKGLFHPITTIDPGFIGPLALSFINLGNVRIRIRHGDPIAKLVCVGLSAYPRRIYGVTQTPSQREGNTDIALVVDRPEHRDVDSELSNMYGQPIKRLYERMATMSQQIEVGELKSLTQSGQRRRQIIFGVVCALFGGLAGTASTIAWELFKPASVRSLGQEPAKPTPPATPRSGTP